MSLIDFCHTQWWQGSDPPKLLTDLSAL